MRAVWGFISATLTQQSRDRTSFFFMLVLPVAIIVIIGTSFGGPTSTEIGVVGDGDLADEVAAALASQASVEVEQMSIDEARADIRRFDLDAAVVVSDDGYGVLSSDVSSGSFAAVTTIQRVVDRIEAGIDVDAPSGVTVRTVGDDRFATQGAFALTSAQNLVLFTFITALTSAVLIVRARTNGVLHRALTAPISATTVVIGVGAGWFVLAMVQSGIIVVVGGLGFGVDWGDPVAVIALLVVFALVGAGAGLLLGSSIDSENTVGSASAPAALVLAALGGCMVPIEIFPDGLRTVAKATPHFWAMEGWKSLMFDGVGISGIATELLVLSGFAVALVGASAVVLRRSLVD